VDFQPYSFQCRVFKFQGNPTFFFLRILVPVGNVRPSSAYNSATDSNVFLLGHERNRINDRLATITFYHCISEIPEGAQLAECHSGGK
jgi:hypothetical protein